MRLKSILLFIMIIAIATIQMPTTTQAQEGGDELTEIEELLITRMLNSLDKIPAYDNVVMSIENVEAQDFAFDLNGQEASIFIAQTTQGQSAYVLDGDTINMHSFLSIGYEEVDPENETRYTMDAEIRALNDEELYVQAVYGDQFGNVQELPEGWQQVEALEDFPAYAPLGINALLDLTPVLNDFDFVAANFESVRVETITLDSQRDAEVVTINFRDEGFVEVFQSLQPSDAPANLDVPLFNAIFDNLDYEQSEIIISVAIDGENNPLVTAVQINLTTNPFDLTLLDAENFTVNDQLVVRLLIQQNRELLSFNADDVEPVAPPETE